MDLYESQIKMIVRFPTGICEIFTNERKVLWNLRVCVDTYPAAYVGVTTR